METRPKVTIYYDGTCNLCAGTIDTLHKSSKKDIFETMPVSTDRLPTGISFDNAMHDVHVVDENGRVYKGVDAVLRVFDEYPHLRFLARFGRLPGIHFFGKIIYRIVEQTRYSVFGRR